MKTALVVAFIYCAVAENLFALAYGSLFPWRLTSLGRQMLAYSASVAAIMDLALLGYVWRPWPWLFLVGYVVFGLSLTWRLVILFRMRTERV